MCMLAEMTSDDMKEYLQGKSCEFLYKEHKEEITQRVYDTLEASKKRPVPPNIIIRCRDGENMSLPITLVSFRTLQSTFG